MGAGGDFEDADCRKGLELSSRGLQGTLPVQPFGTVGLPFRLRDQELVNKV